MVTMVEIIQGHRGPELFQRPPHFISNCNNVIIISKKHQCTTGHWEFPFWKCPPPPPKKKFMFGKLVDSAHSVLLALKPATFTWSNLRSICKTVHATDTLVISMSRLAAIDHHPRPMNAKHYDISDLLIIKYTRFMFSKFCEIVRSKLSIHQIMSC